MFKVKVHANKKTVEFQVSGDYSLLYHLRNNGIFIDSHCSGNGTCGKCRIKVISPSTEASAKEIELLGLSAAKEGYRLACKVFIKTDLEVSLEDTQNTPARIITEGIQRGIALKPLVSKVCLTLEKPGLSDQRDDLSRLTSDTVHGLVDLAMLRRLPSVLREKGYIATIVSFAAKPLTLEPGDTSRELYGVAVDIGTTTIACYLFDLTTGKKLSVNSLLNPQKIYGADVISRIKHTMDFAEGLEQLQSLVINAINTGIGLMCTQTGISSDGIYAITLAGNTTMLHLLLGVNPGHIAAAPFTPVFTSKINLQARELGISINPSGLVCVLPSVSAYIGADTVAAVLSTGMSEQADISLLIDIGTNGEIVLGNKDFLYACSSAAGPAFEGASIRNGTGSITGAISGISLTQGLHCSTIGDSSPIGICGTGIVDALAQLLEVGIVDETGRIDTGWKAHDPALAALAGRITPVDGINAFVLYSEKETLTGRDIAVTQKDIRELQNAKAAIAAGIHVLVREAGISFEAIRNVYLAGGFGSYINIESALKIGLLPEALRGKIVTVGNAAGQGAIEVLLSKACLHTAENISKNIKYVELSASKTFNEFYIECMMFET